MKAVGFGLPSSASMVADGFFGLLQASVLLLRPSVAEVFIGQASVVNLGSGGCCCTQHPVAALRLPRVRDRLGVLARHGLAAHEASRWPCRASGCCA